MLHFICNGPLRYVKPAKYQLKYTGTVKFGTRSLNAVLGILQEKYNTIVCHSRIHHERESRPKFDTCKAYTELVKFKYRLYSWVSCDVIYLSGGQM